MDFLISRGTLVRFLVLLLCRPKTRPSAAPPSAGAGAAWVGFGPSAGRGRRGATVVDRGAQGVAGAPKERDDR